MTPPPVDPALPLILRAVLSAVLVRAALHKLRDPSGFRSTVANYQLLPRAFVPTVSVLLVLTECGVAVGLWWPSTANLSAALAASLFLVYAGAILVNLMRGRRDVECGCAGAAAQQTLGGGLVLRNGLLALVATGLLLPTQSRSLLWIDGVTIIGGATVLALIYLAAEGLLAQVSRMRRLRGRLVGLQETARA